MGTGEDGELLGVLHDREVNVRFQVRLAEHSASQRLTGTADNQQISCRLTSYSGIHLSVELQLLLVDCNLQPWRKVQETVWTVVGEARKSWPRRPKALEAGGENPASGRGTSAELCAFGAVVCCRLMQGSRLHPLPFSLGGLAKGSAAEIVAKGRL